VTPYLSFAVSEPSQVGEARRAAMRLAAEAGLDEVVVGRVGIVVTELGTNLERHAEHGRLMFGLRPAEAGTTLEIVSVDRGPGMADVEKCLRDGYSTGSTPGSGLGAVRRLSAGFSAFSLPGRGTAIVARVGSSAAAASSATVGEQAIVVAGICIAAPGENVSGDGWSAWVNDGVASVMVADGLGHGPGAAEASDVAVATFVAARSGPRDTLERAHQAMRSTRGAAMAVASLDSAANTISFAGVGNIAGRLISGVEDRSLLSQHGTVGLQMRRVVDVAYPWPEHSLFVLHSDGIASRWSLAEAGALLQCDPALVAAWLIRDHTRGKDDATVVVIRRA
jgi:anti-sigma regulatory factor (Ser/Thr protein kinase)